MQYDHITHLLSEAAHGACHGTLLAQVSQKIPRTTKTGTPYLDVKLADATGSLLVKIWNNAPWYADFMALPEDAAIAVTASWQQTAYGLDATNIDLCPLTPEQEETLLAGGAALTQQQQADWDTICRLAKSLQDPRLHALCQEFLSKHEARFRRTAAAQEYHHARRGGLVEHTAGVMKAADALCSAYPQLNRDLVLAGALFHDCGKMWENTYPEKGLSMSCQDMGVLLGHIPLGIELVNKLWQSISTPARREEWKNLQPETEQVRLHLLHLVASHHGSMEFGSPVVPKTPEAVALHHADNMDAKMEMFRSVYASAPSPAPHVRQGKRPLPSQVTDPLPSFSGNAP